MAAEPGAAPARVLGRVALGVFLLLLVFGLILLFSPELATDLDERSAGSAATGEAVSITETKRTTEETSHSERGSSANKRSTRAANAAGGQQRRRPNDGNSRTTQTSSSDQTTSTTTTETTTETVTPAVPDQTSWAADVFAVPAVTVLLRLATIALLAALAALPLAWTAMRRASRNGPTANAATTKPAHPAATRDPVPNPGPQPPPPPGPLKTADARTASTDGAAAGRMPERSPALPVKPVVTRLEAERAKAGVIAGIPLLREIFEERGEPNIANTLPDMRVRVKLTDTIAKEQPLPVSVLAEDPTLALATFRTEVEQRLRRLARDAVAQSAHSIDEILTSLTDEGLFDPDASAGLRNLLKMSERAARGARIDPAMGAWVREEGVSLLLSLDLMLPS